MPRKTFSTKEEATKYQEDTIKEGGMAVIGSLGEKFRVYLDTKEDIERIQGFRGDRYNQNDIQLSLRRTAMDTKKAVGDALALQQSMESGEIYTDYEASVEAARIMVKNRDLKTADDVIAFLDDIREYDEIMKELIEETLDSYDYEAKYEVAKD